MKPKPRVQHFTVSSPKREPLRWGCFYLYHYSTFQGCDLWWGTIFCILEVSTRGIYPRITRTRQFCESCTKYLTLPGPPIHSSRNIRSRVKVLCATSIPHPTGSAGSWKTSIPVPDSSVISMRDLTPCQTCRNPQKTPLDHFINPTQPQHEPCPD